MTSEELDIDAVFQLEDEALKTELEQRNLATDGDRGDLQERLLHHITMNTSVLDDDNFKHSTSTVDSILGDQSALLEESVVGGTGAVEAGKVEDGVELDGAIDFLMEKESTSTTPSGTSPQCDSAILSPSTEDEEVRDESEKDATSSGDADDNKNSVTERIKNITAAAKKSKTPKTNGATDRVASEETAKARSLPNTRKMNIIRVVPPSSKGEKLEQRNKRFGGGGEKLEQRSKRFGGPTNEEEKKKLRLGRFSASPAPSIASPAPSTSTSADESGKVVKKVKPLSGSPADRLKERQARFADGNLKKRQERFGTITSRSLNVETDMKTRKLMRAQKFGTVS